MTPDRELPAGRLLDRIDCTIDFPPDRYFSHGDVQVVETGAGRYREAEACPLSRFGYRFAIEHVGRPHVAIIRYPDDRRRFMTIMDGTCYDLSTGVTTGLSQPLSGEMLELRQIFWPRWNDCSIVFTTWSTGEPAAVASVEVRELDDLPSLEAAPSGLGPLREIGVQYEDPCGTGGSEGAQTKDEWLDRVARFMRHTGQGLLVYPLAWYHGPQFPSEREPADAFDVVVGRDRRQYSRWTTHPPEWVVPILERFERDGLGFQGALTLLRLGSLMRQMTTNPDAARSGEPTINSVSCSGDVQTGAGDWTRMYNARNYTALSRQFGFDLDLSHFPWAYGEGHPPQAGPIFNPVHPTVQEAIIGFVREIAERYGAYPAFKGVSLNMWHATIAWFGSLRFGYDDLTVAMFESETGVAVPGDLNSPDRFMRRFEFLTGVCRAAWIEWRCRKIHRLICNLRDALIVVRPDLVLTLTLWQETTIPMLYGFPGAAHQLWARGGAVELYREGGLDVGLFRDEPGVHVDIEIGNPRGRGGHATHSTSGTEAPLEATCMYRDHDFLDRETLDAIGDTAHAGAFIFNCWVEAWGKHRWFPCELDDTEAQELALMNDEPAEGIFRMNSEYPDDGFWWDSQLRITHGLPAGAHYMEPFAHALAELDAQRITRGGLFLDSAHAAETSAFARVYRELPCARFESVCGATDPVAVRSFARDGERYVYLVNREYYPVSVTLMLNGPARLRELGVGQAADVPVRWELTLGPYELRAFAGSERFTVDAVATTSPSDIVSALTVDAEQAIADMDLLAATGRGVPGMERMRREIAAAVRNGRPAWLRRALSGYIVLKCREMLASRQAI